MSSPDPFNLARFVDAQDPMFERVVAELQSGLKRSHWMWFIFPQIDGLGFSPTSQYFSIKSQSEARAYLAHPVLGARIMQCVEIVLALEGPTAADIFGPVDEMKLRSSMTLFAQVAGQGSPYAAVLTKYFCGEPDRRTLQLLRGATEDGQPT